MKLILSVLILSLVCLAACNNKSNSLAETENPEMMVEKRALEWLAEDVVITYNQDKSMALMVKSPPMDPRNPTPTIRAIVYDVAMDKALYDESIARGKIRWADNDHVHILSVPGMVQKGQEDEDPGYYLHVKTKERKKSL